MKLTEEEKQIILEKRAKDAATRAKKSAKLKHDLYYVSNDPDCRHIFGTFISKKDIDSLIKEIRDGFELTVPKNTKFVCFMEDGDELWYDDENYGIESMDDDWAKENLVNIREIK